MLRRVIGNVLPTMDSRVVTVTRKEDKVGDLLGGGYKSVQIELDAPTEGAVDTILKAREYIDDGPLLIANTDQLCAFDVNDFIAKSAKDGSIVTFKSSKTDHSYVWLWRNSTDRGGRIPAEVIKSEFLDAICHIEEKPSELNVSDKAVSGIYYFSKGTDFADAADAVIKKGTKTRGEFYLSSAIKKMVAGGKILNTYDAPTSILGTPEDLQRFEVNTKVLEAL